MIGVKEKLAWDRKKVNFGLRSGQSRFGMSNFGTKLWTLAPNVNFGTKFNWNVNFGTMEKDYVCRS